MIRVMNLRNQTIKIEGVKILPKEYYTWMNAEISDTLRATLYRLRSLSMIQMIELPEEEITQSIVETEIQEEPIQEEIEDVKIEEIGKTEKPKKKNTKKKSQSKGE